MAEFEYVRVIINRSSVSMGDDVDSHVEFWDLPVTATVDDLLVAISTWLPSVAGPAGWCVYRDIHDLSRRRVLGLIYTSHDRDDENRICRYARGGETLGRLARDSELAVHAVYLSGDAARPVAVSEVRASTSFTGALPSVLGSEARQYALIDWRTVNENRRLAADVRDTRRAWIRDYLLRAETPPSEAERFVAANFHFLTELLCPASMRIAGELLDLGDKLRTGADALQRTGNPSMATLAMVLAAFEWGIHKEESWRFAPRDHCRIYLEFLARCGYRPSAIERVMAGDTGVEQLTDKQARTRELRNAEYHLARNHGYGLMTHEQYLALLAPIETELRQLGEVPEHRVSCCS